VATGNISVRLAVVDGQKVKAELRDVGETGQRALKRIENAAEPASRSLRMLDGAAGEVRNTMEGMTGRLGVFGGALSALGPAGLAAGAALAVVSAGMVAGLREAAEAERSYRRLEAVLKATGHASGLTGKQIVDFADDIERSTLVTSEAVQEAAAVLATFRAVSGETFTRTLALAQDMATVFGQDLSSAAMQLGKALQDPEQGLNALRRVGISFSASQRELIQTLIDTGQTAEAQRVILAELERQVGGAGAAEAGGLTGATNRLSDAWGNFLEQLGQTSGVSAFVQETLGMLARAAETTTAAMRGARLEMIEGRLSVAPAEDFDAQIAQAERKIEESKKALLNPGLTGLRRKWTHSEVEEGQQEIEALRRQQQEAAATETAEREKALAGQRAAEAEARAERVAGLRGEIEKGITQHATAAEKRAAIDKEYADKRKQIEAQRTAENAAEVDKTLGRQEELHRRQIAALDASEAKKGAASVKRAAAGEKAAAREATRNAEVIQQLSRQMETVDNKRQQFIDQALSRISAGATEAQRAEVEKLAGALYDQREAQQKADEATREGIRITRQMLTPAEEYTDTLARLKVLLDADAISQETFNRAMLDAAEDFARSQEWLLRTSREWQDGARVALGDYVDEATNAARGAEEAMTIAFQGMEDALTSMVVKGKLDFGSLADSIVADITRIAIKQAILAPLAEGLMGSSLFGGTAAAAGSAAAGAVGEAASSGWLSGIAKSAGTWLASWFHEGGIVGQGAPPTRMVDPALFLGAPRYHGGGLAGAYASGALKPDEMPAILQRGERVLSRQQVAKGMNASRSPVNVVMNITTPDVGGFRASQGQLAADAARTLARVQRRNL
jgi:lambda family phage tail tape measure protein